MCGAEGSGGTVLLVGGGWRYILKLILTTGYTHPVKVSTAGNCISISRQLAKLTSAQ